MKQLAINEQTLIPVSLFAVTGSALVGLVYRASQLDSFVKAHEVTITKLQAKSEAQMEVLLTVKEDVAVIKHIVQEKKK